MNLTLALPALNRQTDESVPPLSLHAFNRILRFGNLHRQTASASEFYARYLWRGSLLGHARTAAGVGQDVPAVLASPVWQQMGLHSAGIVGGEYIGIGRDEAEQFCRDLSEFYRDDGWHFVSVRPDLWLVVMPEIQDWQVRPVLDVCGQTDASEHAAGRDGGQWLARQTEIQMWLHQHPLNNLRTRNKQPAVNGLWLWHDLAGSGQHAALFTDSPWAQFASGIRADAPHDWRACETLMQETGADDAVVFLDDLAATRQTADVFAYRGILEDWEQRWFAPLWQAVCTGKVKKLTVATDGENGGTLTLTSKSRWKFWKPEKTFGGIW